MVLVHAFTNGKMHVNQSPRQFPIIDLAIALIAPSTDVLVRARWMARTISKLLPLLLTSSIRILSAWALLHHSMIRCHVPRVMSHAHVGEPHGILTATDPAIPAMRRPCGVLLMPLRWEC